jgi:16S rRNA (guanine527-N7)-methyltransferase
VSVAVRDVGSRIRSRLKRHGVGASDEQVKQLSLFVGLLTKWNRTVNLTALKLEPLSDEAIDRLILEPLIAAELVRKLTTGTGHLIDLGSGGGSPAIPLKIALPGMRLSMVESKVRKSAFLRELIRQLALMDATVLTARIEELLALPELHESAELLSIRAVRADRGLWQTVSAFVRQGGLVLWFRSGSDQAKGAPFFPAFQIETTERVAATNSELVVLRRQH